MPTCLSDLVLGHDIQPSATPSISYSCDNLFSEPTRFEEWPGPRWHTLSMPREGLIWLQALSRQNHFRAALSWNRIPYPPISFPGYAWVGLLPYLRRYRFTPIGISFRKVSDWLFWPLNAYLSMVTCRRKLIQLLSREDFFLLAISL